MQSPGSTDVPFKYRGWTLDFDLGPEGDRFKFEEAQNAEALSGQAAEGARRRDRRLWQPPPLAGPDRDGLVDELRRLVYPLVLGTGDRLFGETQDKVPLRLVESRPFGGGVVSVIYALRG
jgi:hypothetical protein